MTGTRYEPDTPDLGALPLHAENRRIGQRAIGHLRTQRAPVVDCKLHEGRAKCGQRNQPRICISTEVQVRATIVVRPEGFEPPTY